MFFILVVVTLLGFSAASVAPAAGKNIVTAATGPGSITTGYGLISGSYASTDTTCTKTPTSLMFAPLGACIPQDGSTYVSYTADSSNNVYASMYSNSACTTMTGSTAMPQQTCTCTTSGCSKGTMYYGAALPTSSTLSGAWWVWAMYGYGASTSCTSPVATIAYVPLSDTTCPKTGCGTTDSTPSGGGTTTKNPTSFSCIGTTSTTPTTTPGSITTGYATYQATFASTDSKCTTPISGTIFAVGACIAQSTSSSLMITADSSNNVYASNYANAACTGTPSVSAPPTSPCTSSSTGYTKGFYYLGTSWVPPTGAYSLMYTYPGASCSAPYQFQFQVGGTCTAKACKAYVNGPNMPPSISNQTVCVAAATPPTFRPTLAGGATAAPTAAAVTVVKATQGLSCSTCLLSSWGTPGSSGYTVQYNAMATAFQTSLYSSLKLGTLGGNVTVTGFSQASTSRRGLLAPTLTAAYTVRVNNPTVTFSTLQAALVTPAVSSSLNTALQVVTGSAVTASTPVAINASPTSAPTLTPSKTSNAHSLRHQSGWRDVLMVIATTVIATTVAVVSMPR